MNWLLRWPEIFLAAIVTAFEAYRFGNTTTPAAHATWTPQRKLDMRNQVRDLWYHGYTSYMRFAFPLDELAPLSCTGRGPDWDLPGNFAYNDVAGNFSLTLIDTLDTLVVLNDRAGFEDAVRKVIRWVSFDVNTKPQIFETNIRVLGGLLSGHLFASRQGQPFHLPWYRGELLTMAHDLGRRFLPAFSTPTGLPYARINLRHGISAGESVETCTAGAGSLILEFATLSRLTGDPRFEKVAHKAFFELWNRRSDIGLVGNTVNAWTGDWMHPQVSSVGAGIDSFFEYALKWYILSGEHEFLDVWNESYAAIMRYSRSLDGLWYRQVHMTTGEKAYNTLDSLSAFWPGLQVLAGDVESAIKSHLLYWQLWKRHAGIPEVWDMSYRQATSLQYPLRPEFIESTWYLYRATRDPMYLDIGKTVLSDLLLRAKVECGIASIRDLRNNALEDKMESFVLSETLKYLYLLFDEDNSLHNDDSNYVFTTEGHILTLEQKYLKLPSATVRRLRRAENQRCPAYEPPFFIGAEDMPGLYVGIRSRSDFDFARFLVSTALSDGDETWWHPNGWCTIPAVDLYSQEFILSVDGKTVEEDTSPSLEKIYPVSDGFMVRSITGVRARIVRRLDGKGYDVTKMGPHTVLTGQTVYINDTALATSLSRGKEMHIEQRHTNVEIRIFIDFVDPNSYITSIAGGPVTDAVFTATTGIFAGDPTNPHPHNGKALRFGQGEGVGLVRDLENPTGCQEYTQKFADEAILVRRGECTFLEKLIHAHEAGASGVVVINDSNTSINPSATAEDLEDVGDSLDDVAIVVLGEGDGRQVSAMLDAAEDRHTGRVVLVLEGTQCDTASVEQGPIKENSDFTEKHVLYINGHALLNTRLLV
ncbi:alpha-mannosidase [Russula earlei]|uniref:Alpha-mannosidase n=1 Tax=Russula earlei TaxID=71964 RepID=A0ACC0UHE1_9AGAM|nr:alpha-mannosidase [Russula earlei]